MVPFLRPSMVGSIVASKVFLRRTGTASSGIALGGQLLQPDVSVVLMVHSFVGLVVQWIDVTVNRDGGPDLGRRLPGRSCHYIMVVGRHCCWLLLLIAVAEEVNLKVW